MQQAAYRSKLNHQACSSKLLGVIFIIIPRLRGLMSHRRSLIAKRGIISTVIYIRMRYLRNCRGREMISAARRHGDFCNEKCHALLSVALNAVMSSAWRNSSRRYLRYYVTTYNPLPNQWRETSIYRPYIHYCEISIPLRSGGPVSPVTLAHSRRRGNNARNKLASR